MPEELTKSKPRSRKLLAAIIFLVGLGIWSVMEHHRADVQAQMLEIAQQRVATLEKQMTVLQQQLAKTTAKLNDLAQKNLPISVVFRPARSGNGLMTYFKNNSASPIEISVVLTNPATNRRREANLTIQGNSVQEIGELQGWIFAPGQRVQVTNAQFGTVEYVVAAN